MPLFKSLGTLLLLACASVQAQTSPALQDIAHAWLQQAATQALPSGATALRIETRVGEPDSRLKLAPCAKVEPYQVLGTRLWGATRVGLRCADGIARWNISLPATVSAWGDAWVVKTFVPAGGVLTQADVIRSPVDWAQENSPVLEDPAQWLGYLATRQLSTGQTLRQGMLKPAQVFVAGAPVRVLAQGAGFEISSDAQALSAGVVGQPARVRMENGRITSGLVLDARTVKIDL